MRVLGLVVMALGAGCAGGDDTPFHGAGGGGHGTTGDAPDAGPDETDAGVTSTLTGQVCVILDWSDPFACADIGLSHQVQVADLATGGAVTSTDDDGRFTLPLTTAGATIRVGGETGDLLVSTQSVQLAASSPVKAPVVDEGLWDATLATLLETQTEGAGVVYVVDPGGPVVGATIAFTTGVPLNARKYYDDGAGGFDANATVTGADGSALFLDIQNAGIRAITEDGRTGSVFLNTGSLELGIAVISLPAAP